MSIPVDGKNPVELCESEDGGKERRQACDPDHDPLLMELIVPSQNIGESSDAEKPASAHIEVNKARAGAECVAGQSCEGARGAVRAFIDRPHDSERLSRAAMVPGDSVIQRMRGHKGNIG